MGLLGRTRLERFSVGKIAVRSILMFHRYRIFRKPFVSPFLTCLVFTWVAIASGEQLPVDPEHAVPERHSYSPTFANGITGRIANISKGYLFSRITLPRQARVSRSHRPLRQITLVGGDHFVAECLDWKSNTATFRLLNRQIIQVPVSSVATLTNPAGETDLIAESFEAETTLKLKAVLDKSHAADGRSSLRIDSSHSGFQQKFDPPLESARIEFSFQVANNDPSSGFGEWRLEWNRRESKIAPLIVRIGPDRMISVFGIPRSIDSMSQSLRLSEGRHSFIGLVSTDRIRLIVDDSILVSCPASGSLLAAIDFRPTNPKSNNAIWIDDFQIRRFKQIEVQTETRDESIKQDTILTSTGDQLFGRITQIADASITFEAGHEPHSFTWTQLAGLVWRQPPVPIHQISGPVVGAVAKIEMQPFVDRPECESERWTVTITSADSKQIVAQHPLIGELKLEWRDILRIDPLFFGQTRLLDARRFHLGNSIRTDFHRHLPDGTELRVDFDLDQTPTGRNYLSLEASEVEAACAEAPPASPFLSRLRAGKLVTEVRINNQSLGSLNQLICYKALPQSPDRIRIEIPHGVLSHGKNTVHLKQHPLIEQGQEYDDCEIGVIRLETEN